MRRYAVTVYKALCCLSHRRTLYWVAIYKALRCLSYGQSTQPSVARGAERGAIYKALRCLSYGRNVQPKGKLSGRRRDFKGIALPLMWMNPQRFVQLFLYVACVFFYLPKDVQLVLFETLVLLQKYHFQRNEQNPLT